MANYVRSIALFICCLLLRESSAATVSLNPPEATTAPSNPPEATTAPLNPPEATPASLNSSEATTAASNPLEATTVLKNPPEAASNPSNPPEATTVSANPTETANEATPSTGSPLTTADTTNNAAGLTKGAEPTTTEIVQSKPVTTESVQSEAKEPTNKPTAAPTTDVAVVVGDLTTEPETTVTTTPATEITTMCESICPYNYERHPTECRCICTNRKHTISPNRYILVWGEFTFDMACPSGTIWVQKACGCDYAPKNSFTATKDLSSIDNYRSCITIINYELDATVDKYTDGKNWVDLENDVNPVAVAEAEGATVNNKAANFSHNSIVIQILHGNDLTDTAYFAARFKPTAPKDNVTRVVFSNGCAISSSQNDLPSILLSFNSVENKIFVAVRTKNQSNGVCENAKPDQFGWYKVVISVKNSVSTVHVNGVECLKLTGKGNIAITDCGLTIGGDPLRHDFARDFNGYVDYMKVMKHCSSDADASNSNNKSVEINI